MQPGEVPASELPASVITARKIAFVLAKMACDLGLPLRSSPDVLLQGAMERPEAVTPEEFQVAYAMRFRNENA